MNESALRTRVMKWLKVQPEVWVYKSSDRYTSGVPDIIGCCQGRFFAMELKTEIGKVSRIQEWVISEIRRSRGEARVIRSVDDARKMIWELKDLTGGR